MDFFWLVMLKKAIGEVEKLGFSFFFGKTTVFSPTKQQMIYPKNCPTDMGVSENGGTPLLVNI